MLSTGSDSSRGRLASEDCFEQTAPLNVVTLLSEARLLAASLKPTAVPIETDGPGHNGRTSASFVRETTVNGPPRTLRSASY